MQVAAGADENVDQHKNHELEAVWRGELRRGLQ